MTATAFADTAAGEATARPHVLCVDDEPLVLAALRDSLRRRFDVTTADSGAAALRLLAERGPFTVVVSDYMMPRMDGAAFLAHARRQAPDAVRILLTGQATIAHAARVVNDGGIFRLLLKPCPPPELLRAIEAGVEQARLVTADRVLVQRKLDEMASHLLRAERLATLGTMVAAVGHELNNILMGLEGATVLIDEHVAAGMPPAPEDLRILKDAQRHLTMHARNLLHLGRPARASEIDTADLGRAVTDTLNILRAAGILRRVRLRVGVPPVPVVVSARASDIEQMLVNLVKNAVDALLEGRHPDPTIVIRVGDGGEPATACCEVSDNGGGIAADRLAQVFEPYFTTKPPERGTGLGLFVVRQIARRAGGDVTVVSEPGRGAAFTVVLPRAAGGEAVILEA